MGKRYAPVFSLSLPLRVACGRQPYHHVKLIFSSDSLVTPLISFVEAKTRFSKVLISFCQNCYLTTCLPSFDS